MNSSYEKNCYKNFTRDALELNNLKYFLIHISTLLIKYVDYIIYIAVISLFVIFNKDLRNWNTFLDIHEMLFLSQLLISYDK